MSRAIKKLLHASEQDWEDVKLKRWLWQKAQKAGDMIELVGAELLFLSPYSPDLNPIEKMRSKIKAILKTLKSGTEKTLINAY